MSPEKEPNPQFEKYSKAREESWFNLKDYFTETDVLQLIPKNIASK